MAKLLYIYGVASIAHGHDKLSHQIPLHYGDHVFSLQGHQLVQNPDEPISGTGNQGSSPMRYFADEMAKKCVDDDIAVAGVDIAGHHSWKDGIHMWTRSSAVATLHQIQGLLDNGWKLAGIIVGVDGGFDDSKHELASFGHEFHVRMQMWRKVLGAPHLPAFLMQSGDLQPNHLSPAGEVNLREFRRAEANIHHFDHDALCVRSSPSLGQIGDSPFHFSAKGAHDFGHDIGDAVFHYTTIHHPDWLI